MINWFFCVLTHMTWIRKDFPRLITWQMSGSSFEPLKKVNTNLRGRCKTLHIILREVMTFPIKCGRFRERKALFTDSISSNLPLHVSLHSTDSLKAIPSFFLLVLIKFHSIYSCSSLFILKCIDSEISLHNTSIE